MPLRRVTLTAALLAVLVPATAQAAKPSGSYSGPDRVVLEVSGRTIELLGFDFPCRESTGRTTLNGLEIRKARGKWRFRTLIYASATYADGHPDENIKVRIRGRFSPTGKVVKGVFRVRSPHCGRTGPVRWWARR